MFIQGLLVLFGALVFIYYSFGGKRKNFPPGPILCLPILGHLPLLGSVPCRRMMEWGKHYGPVVGIQLGSYSAVVINDCRLIRKAFKQNNFAGRPRVKILDESSGNRKGFIFADGVSAMEQRRFSIRVLKDFGSGKSSLESRILDQVPHVLQVFCDHLSKPLDVKHAFSRIIFNVLWGLVASKSFEEGDKDFQQWAANVSRTGEMTTMIEKLAMFVKFVPDWLPKLSGLTEKLQGMQMIANFMEEIVQERKANRVRGIPEDFIDAYLEEVEKTSDPESSFFAAHDYIKYTLQDLFIAGVETTTSTFEWLLYYLAKYPSVQQKLQREIDAVMDTNIPNFNYREKIPYAEAVIQEVLRITSLLPLSLFHNTFEDTELNGYTIPKNTMVLGNIYAVHHDADVWGDPNVFRPERFLHEGKLTKIDEFIPFSVGKRNCVGEQLARLQLFLMTVSIFRQFSVKAMGKLPSDGGIYGITITVHPFQVQVIRREKQYSSCCTQIADLS